MMTVLALDTTSPELSIGLARDGNLLASTSAPQRSASAHLLPLIDELLEGAGLHLSDLDGLVALRGPGSFTGIRIGLATAQGIRQAAGLPTTAWSTLEVVARATPRTEGTVLALVHALRDDWYSQRFSCRTIPVPLEEARRRTMDELVELRVDFASRIASQHPVVLPFTVTTVTSPASIAALSASLSPPTWDPTLLSQPLYLAPPPASLPKAPKRVMPATS